MFVSVIKTDRRQVRYRDHPDVRRKAVQGLNDLLEAKIRLARQLVVLDRDKAFVVEDCSSIGHFGVMHGGDPGETRQFCDVGYALEAFPGLEGHLRAGEIPFRSAVALGRLCRTEGAIRPEDEWIQAARTSSATDLWRAVRARIEEVQQGVAAVSELTIYVTEKTRKAFDRACVLESRRARTVLTRGQVFARIVERILDLEDPNRVRPGKRRLGPTSELPDSRTIPQEVRRLLRKRSGDQCEFPGCTHKVFIQKAHLGKSKAAGGGQEIQDLGDLCDVHHTMRDAGRFQLVGWTTEFRPLFRQRSGRVLWPQGGSDPPSQ